jgi:hypothetical protein
MIKGATTYVYIYGMEHSSSGTNLQVIFFFVWNLYNISQKICSTCVQGTYENFASSQDKFHTQASFILINKH